MGKLNLKLEPALSSKHLDEITEMGEQRMKEARLNSLPLGYDGISLIDTLEAIDDDDKAAIEAARRESEDIAAAIKNPPQFIEEDPPPGHTMDDFISDSLPIGEFLAPPGDEESLFQEIAEECEPVAPELQAEIDRMIKELENLF